jgi:hypothetical protein
MLQRIGSRMRFVVGMGVRMAEVSGLLNRRTFFQLDLACTTVAAAIAAFADVIGTGVFGTGGANTRGFLAANTTVERHG